MKLRKQIRHLYESLRLQVARTLAHAHDHQPFVIKGTGCMLCQLLERGDHPFAALQLAREQGLAREWFPAERELFELVGEKAFQAKVVRDIETVKNMPKKLCEYCGGRPVCFMSTKEIAYFMLNSSKKQYVYSCGECGNRVLITLEDIPEPLLKAVYRKIAAIRRKRKFIKKSSIKSPLYHNPQTLHELLQTHTGPPPGESEEP